MYKIGLTGGIACGKTTVCSFLREAGASIIDTDKISHDLALPNQALWQAYINHFGSKILNADKSLSRRMIGNIVFTSQSEKKWINKISHPLIQQEVEKQIENLAEKKEKAVIIDVPLLFETGWDKYVDEKWVIAVDKKTQIDRLRSRNGYSFAEARRRIRAQMPLSYKIKRADKVINTAHPLDINKRRTIRLWFSLLKCLEQQR